jgi:acetylcholinesterase
MLLLPVLAITCITSAFDLTNPPLLSCPRNGLIVGAPSGIYRGLINGTAPNVRQFHSVPYAKSPVGPLRFRPPQKPDARSMSIRDASQLPASCPQVRLVGPSIYTEVVSEYGIAGPISEDCLYLSIWTPSDAENLPVVLFLPGGGFQSGGIDVTHQKPHHWVQRTQAHIVVSVNYRLSIFGFPNAAGLTDQNLGILDQRLALEWVRDNIASFGGDPRRITLWGQSSGATSVDYHIHAFREDPIAIGFFMQSGNALLQIRSTDLGNTHSRFTDVARAAGYSVAGPEDELQYMQELPLEDLLHHFEAYAEQAGPILFSPVVDERVVFSNYSERYATHTPPDIPAIVTTVENEGIAYVPFSYNSSEIDEALGKIVGDKYFYCPSVRTTALRSQAGLTTYRAIYSGVFPNVSPLPWMKSFHASDLPMYFGTFEDLPNLDDDNTDYLHRTHQYETGTVMQEFLLAFMQHPRNALQAHGWPNGRSGSIAMFGKNHEAFNTVEAGDCEC